MPTTVGPVTPDSGAGAGALVRVDVQHRRGDSVVAQLPAFYVGGVPLDMSTWTGWKASVRPAVDQSVTATPSVDTTYAVDGEIDVTLAAATSAGLTAGRYVWDVEATTDLGKVVTIAAGWWTVIGDIAV